MKVIFSNMTEFSMKSGLEKIALLPFGRTGKIIVFLIFSFFLSASVFAQKDTVKTIKNDNSPIAPRYPAPRHLEKYKNDRDYNYNENQMPANNPLDRWLDWIQRKIRSFFGSKSYDNFWQYVIMAITAGLVFYLLYKAKVLDYVFPSKGAGTSADYIVGQENIHEINFEDAIVNALGQKDFRLAIRLQYLRILKLLTTKELIHWKPNLTNQVYVQELEKYPYHPDFVQITRYFEFAWYGDFQVSEAGFREMKEFSDSFVKKVNT